MDSDPSSDLKSPNFARKLPIKRRTLTPPPSTPTHTSSPDDNGPLEDDEEFSNYSDDFVCGGGGSQVPPFKFQRIWSESDEIRFLQGLLGSHAQGMVFPRDLNLFFDRFSESMAQPFTRSQLSEKLRRLRTKFRIMSARVDRGQDPSRLAPHDRDVLHLCTRLWHPDHASSSPFSHTDSSGSSNKRRRRNPRPISTAPAATAIIPPVVLSLPPPPPPPTITTTAPVIGVKIENFASSEGLSIGDAQPKKKKGGLCGVVAKIVIDVLDECVKEASEGFIAAGSVENELASRWKEQRALELEVLSQRWRLVIERSLRE